MGIVRPGKPRYEYHIKRARPDELCPQILPLSLHIPLHHGCAVHAGSDQLTVQLSEVLGVHGFMLGREHILADPGPALPRLLRAWRGPIWAI